ncbi:sugar phosphate isomerase/epimerase [Flaviramulus sp. BrNp1-15]|uniref:sugar phosphate isomerase/epimerase family protein n=1 Tax=Flaviramulus sp. BrNp1-15 TaxID=2916754 RepID=UPI001EE89065|nr:sugar phosphate isomerase/epimerase family protein [Flaviramulus sp. BrNp1-15]ULC59320.1 sugar phosphate isomerase/epimerase [Flaviramulus sp. BrNp1-15]
MKPIINSQKIMFAFLSLSLIFFVACGNSKKEKTEEKQVVVEGQKAPFFKLSIAQWSLHKFVREENGSPFLFASQAKEMGFEGVEYVNQLYNDEIEKLGFDTVIDSLKKVSDSQGIRNVLIMIDHEGDLADPDEEKRNLAVENHKKWVDAAQKLGCHSIRVNTFGTNDPEVWKESVVDGLRKLSEYAATKNINVLCENHGWLSSDADALMQAIADVNMDNCGTLPDFGNWCVKRKDGEQWGECEEEYPDKYKGIEMMLAKADAVSAKSYDFDENGNETTLDYTRILKLVKDAGYTGYIGVEYEGDKLSEKEGILATKALLLKAEKELK